MLLTKQLLALRPNKNDWIFAIKTFVAGILALYIALALDLSYPIWAIGTVFVIANPYTGMAASKSVFRVLGTVLGATVTILVTPSLIHTPWLFTIFLSVWVAVCLYISLLDRTPRSYMFMLAGYTAIIISFTIINNIDTATVFDLAIGRVIEISLGVICSAVVMTSFYPMNIAPAVEHQVNTLLHDTDQLFEQLCDNSSPPFSQDASASNHYSHTLNTLTKDIANLHVMTIHLSYERSKFKGMTKPLQEMLHQLSMAVTNLVAMSERLKQLGILSPEVQSSIHTIYQRVNLDLQAPVNELNLTPDYLPTGLEGDFDALTRLVNKDQRIFIASFKMDLRHFIYNRRVIGLLWHRIKQGNYSLPEHIVPITRHYPHLHRDHGVAIRGGISAFLVTFLSTGMWILSGWKAGYMMAEMAAITACILTALDNPVPALKMFIRANIYAVGVIFIYSFGIFPMVTEYWQAALALAPFILFCLLLYPHPPLNAIGLPLIMGVVMGLNFHNRYTLDTVTFIDSSIATVMGPVISILIISLIRAMSPDMSAQRILRGHYHAIRQALYLPYGIDFRIHLRQMLDSIGVLNTKVVQSDLLKQHIQLAIIECSAMVDLARINELIQKLPPQTVLVTQLEDMLIQIDDLLRAKETQQNVSQVLTPLQTNIQLLSQAAQSVEDISISERLQISLNNIKTSLCHLPSHVASSEVNKPA